MAEMFKCCDPIPKYVCHVCSSFQTNFSVSLKDHIINGHKKGCKRKPKHTGWFECVECDLKFITKNSLEIHLIANHTPSKDIQWYNCSQCSFKCRLSENLERHFNFHHKEAVPVEDTLWFECEHCQHKFTKKEPLEIHLVGCKLRSQYKCERCQCQFRKKKTLKSHLVGCKSRVENRCELDHTKLDHPKPEYFKCGHCTGTFTSKVDLEGHMADYHTSPEDIRWLRCPHCPYKVKQNVSLNQHIRSAHGKGDDDRSWQFQCDHCNKKFKWKGSLKTHVLEKHTEPKDTKWFRCLQCPAMFKKQISQQLHVKLDHCEDDLERKDCFYPHFKMLQDERVDDGESRPFHCPHCDKKFKWRGSLRSHVMKKHIKPEDIWFRCLQCAEKFKRKTELQLHVQLEHRQDNS